MGTTGKMEQERTYTIQVTVGKTAATYHSHWLVTVPKQTHLGTMKSMIILTPLNDRSMAKQLVTSLKWCGKVQRELVTQWQRLKIHDGHPTQLLSLSLSTRHPVTIEDSTDKMYFHLQNETWTLN